MNVLLEDESLLVVDKPAGLATVPERRPTGASLFEQLQAARGERLYIVHRLDKGVSGVVAFARTAAAHRALSAAFEQHAAQKTYLALVHGVPSEALGLIELPLRIFGSGRSAPDAERGKACTTRWRLRQELPPAFALLEVRPVTGRRHQIRAHLCAVGHPVVGDTLYGERKAQERFGRLMLHALRLSLPHPVTAAPLELEATPPADFDEALRTIAQP